MLVQVSWMFLAEWQLSGQRQYCVVRNSLSRAGIMGHTQQQFERQLSYGTLCCHRQPVRILLGSHGASDRIHSGEVTLEPPKAKACARRRECGRLSSSAHFSSGEEDKLSHTKKWHLWQVFVAVRRTSCPVFPPAYPKKWKKCWKSVAYENWSKATWFEEINFIRLGHTTSV